LLLKPRLKYQNISQVVLPVTLARQMFCPFFRIGAGFIPPLAATLIHQATLPPNHAAAREAKKQSERRTPFWPSKNSMGAYLFKTWHKIHFPYPL
jgi:hypothetical protein